MRVRTIRILALLCLFAGVSFGQFTLSTTPNPSTSGDSVQLSATGAPSLVTVTFYDGGQTGTVLGSGVTTSGGDVNISVSTLTVGTHPLSACYPVSPPIFNCTNVVSQVVNPPPPPPPPFALSATPNPSIIGQTVTLTATSAPPFATVTFMDGGPNGAVLGSASNSISSSPADLSIQVSTLTAGSHQLVACFPSDPVPFCSNTVTQVVSPGTTGLQLTSSQNPSVLCQSVTFTATLTPGTATGSITFFDGTATLAIVPVSLGTATFTTTSLALGTHLIQARYVSDAGAGGSSALVTQTVNGAVTITLNSAPNPSNLGQNVTMNAALAVAACGDAPPPPNAPTGSVSFFDGATQIGQGNIVSGTATFQTPALTVGSHNLTALYLGDFYYSPNTSDPVVQVVNQVLTKTNTTTTLAASANPIATGQSVTLTASVAATGTPPSSQTITGQVQFRDGGAVIGTGTVSNGIATFTAAGLSAGSHSLSAFYAGDNNFNSSTSNTINEAVNPPASSNTTTTLSAGPNPANVGQSVTLIATVTPGTASGSVQFLDGATAIGQSNVSGGIATLSLSTFTAGPHTLTARYLGDSVNLPSTSNPVTLSINIVKQNSTTSLSVSSNPVTSGQGLTLTAAVAPSGATGTVQFTDGGSPIGSANLSNGIATLTASALTVGSHVLAATYLGDTNFNPSTSQSIVETVSPTTKSTTTDLVVNLISSTFGQTVSLSAGVSGAGGTPTGTITFSDGDTVLTIANLVNGSASFSTVTLSVGAHSLSASYSGDSTFNPSSSNPVSVQVNKATSTTALAASPTSSIPGQTVVLTAKVSSPAQGTITGTVTFMDGATPIGPPVTLTNGTASITTSTLANGSHTLTAVYSGDANFQGSTSPPIPESVGLTQTTTSLSANPASPSLGQSVTFTATVAPAGATGAVAFLDGGNTLGTGTLDNGTATFTTTGLTAGNHSVTAVYAGDTKFATSTSSAVTLTIPKAPSNIVLSAAPNPSTLGQQVTLRAVATPSSATGTVTFLDGGAALGTAALSNGAATFTTSTLALGTHTLSASYPGDTNDGPSTSAAVTEVINNPVTTPPPSNIVPTALSNAIVGVFYSQSFTVTGGALPLTWTLTGSVPGLTLSPAGVLSGTPTAAGTTSLTVRVQDNASAATAAVLSLTVLPLPAPALSVPTISTPADQPAPLITLSPAYPLPLTATFALSFTPNASNLPANYSNPDVKFTGGGTTTGNIPIPANSSAAIALPAVQVGTVAGTVTITLATLVTSTGQSVLPANPVTATIVVGRLAPVIVPGSVKIINITSTGFSVFLDGSSTTRDLTSANLTFTAASGAQLNGAQATVSLTASSATWFADTGAGRGVANGGSFSLTIPFAYSGDTSAIGAVSVTLTNSVGASTAVSGGR